MPKGLDTDLGQGGVNVSGGQKQRLCIARALLKNPRVLIFDDSTSAVDTATEAKIRSALAALRGVTKIVIAQRISSVMNTDKIVILEDGRIHAVGTHAYIHSALKHLGDRRKSASKLHIRHRIVRHKNIVSLHDVKIILIDPNTMSSGNGNIEHADRFEILNRRHPLMALATLLNFLFRLAHMKVKTQPLLRNDLRDILAHHRI